MFADHGISTVAVVDPLGTLQGIVTESDLIRRLADEDKQPRAGWLSYLLEDPDTRPDRYARSHAATAGELMTKEVVTVRPGETAAHIAHLMEEHRIRRVLVTEGGRLLGLVSRADLVRALVTPIHDSAGQHPDEEIRRAVLAEMKREAWASSLNTAVGVQNGVVEFSGFYHSEAVSRALRVLAGNVPGVKEVVDNTVPLPVMFAG
jgi:CBS domain-containing protein